jgi:hypothetical protein
LGSGKNNLTEPTQRSIRSFEVLQQTIARRFVEVQEKMERGRTFLAARLQNGRLAGLMHWSAARSTSTWRPRARSRRRRYYGLAVLFNIQVDAWPAVLLAFSLYSGAFLGEIWRGSIEAIPRAQWV